MACCLTAPSHYLNQCWLIIRGVLWHTSESSFAGIAQGIDSGYEFEKDILKNIFKSPRGQWVNTLLCNEAIIVSSIFVNGLSLNLNTMILITYNIHIFQLINYIFRSSFQKDIIHNSNMFSPGNTFENQIVCQTSSICPGLMKSSCSNYKWAFHMLLKLTTKIIRKPIFHPWWPLQQSTVGNSRHVSSELSAPLCWIFVCGLNCPEQKNFWKIIN